MRWPLTDRIVAGVVGLCVLVVLALSLAIGSPPVQALDEALIRALRTDDAALNPRWPAWFQEVARDYTALGGYAVLSTLTFLVWAFLRLEGRRQKARFAVLVTISGYVMNMVLKDLINRPRPNIVPHLAHVDGIGRESFPSGHSTMSTIVYVTLALMLSELSARKRVKAFLLIAPLSIAFAVGVSRVMMGVHYPTDVIAGWASGLSWSLGAWLLLRRWRREHHKPK